MARPKNQTKKKKLPKWMAGFNVVYQADEHCMSKSTAKPSAEKCELTIRSAVLINAILDIERGAGVILNDAIRWVNGAFESMPGYSFNDICDTFNISPEAAREAILGDTKTRNKLKRQLDRRTA